MKAKLLLINFILASVFLLYGCIDPPTVTTNEAASITINSADVGGKVTDDGGADVTERGIVYDLSQPPENGGQNRTMGSGTGPFNNIVSELSFGTTYYVKAYAINKAGIGYGSQITFKTLDVSNPGVTTSPVTVITQTTAVVGGNVNADGSAPVTERGVYWGTAQNPETSGTKLQIGSGIGTFSTTLPSLIPDTKYYVKAYAVNSKGTGFGTQINFTTKSTSGIIFNNDLTYGSVSDADGNVYKTIQIGTQTWMAENLRTTKYNDGSSIPLVTSNSGWSSMSSPAFCWYGNDATTNKPVYGGLYNWYVVYNGNLCPTGWHVPSQVEFTTLRDYLGGESVAGGKLKEVNPVHWKSPNTGATNESGFTAVPSGTRTGFDGPFFYLSEDGHYWSSTSFDAGNSYHWYTYYNTSSFQSGNTLKNTGYAIRCIKTEGESVPTNGLVAYYPFKGNFIDESVNTNDGTGNGVQFISDKNGITNQAASLNGTTSYISVPHNSLFNFGTGNFTICALIKTGVIPTYSWSAILTKHNSQTNHDTEFFLLIEGSTGKPQFGLSTNLGVFERITGSTSICDNFYHVLCGIRENAQIKFYVDGILVGTTSSSINPNNTNPLNIGRSSYNSGSGYFNGVIDEILIYNRALTQTEISNLFY